MSLGRGTCTPRRALPLLAAVALLVSCSSAGSSATGSTSPSVSKTTGPTTTTVPPPPPVAPLTGLSQPNPAMLNRPAIVVKIDNVDPARPQSGLDAADIVFEEQVEGQLSRLIAVFQSTDAAHVGPVRSTRTTDIDVVSALNHPLYAYSGGNKSFVQQLDASPLHDVGAATYATPYYGYSGPHASPHNLYASVAALYRLAKAGDGVPPAFFMYRPAGVPPSGAGMVPATHVDVTFGMSTAAWQWNAAAAVWQRTQNGTPDVLQNGQQLAVANVVVQVTPYVPDGYATGEGLNPPPAIPKGETVGSGVGMVFTGGTAIQIHWTKASPTSPTQYTDNAGKPVALTVGRTWVELVPQGSPVNVR